MARGQGKLSARTVAAIATPGRYGDGSGLWLQVTTGGKSWLLRYMLAGRARTMGLGPTDLVSLAEARERAREARRLLLDGIDPLEARATKRAHAGLLAAKETTFRECAERYIAAHEASWRNAQHRRQWRSSLTASVFPVIGALPVDAIDTVLVLKVIEPLWNVTPETASRVRGRIEAILDWAKARGHRGGENPARLRGHLDHLLPSRRKLRRVEHLAALPYTELPAFMAELRKREGAAAGALEFAILTAARTGEVLNARWSEISVDMWTVPANRMKGGKEHRVPLPPRVLDILRNLPRVGEFVFPGARSGCALGHDALLQSLRRMGRAGLTVHGFRSTFRDWAAETTGYPREVAEAALAHAIESKVEAAYRRSDLFEKRRRLMQDWAKFCTAKPKATGDVVPLRAGG